MQIMTSSEESTSLVLIEQYATQVMDFSSQYGSDLSFSYTATNCLGRPSQFPNYGDFHQTYVIREHGHFWETGVAGNNLRKCYLRQNCCADMMNFIDLKYKLEVYPPFMCYIYETFNPGAVQAIFGGNNGRWKKLWARLSPEEAPRQPRAFSPQLARTDFPINVLRIIFNHRNVRSHSQIDAVALLGTGVKAQEDEKGKKNPAESIMCKFNSAPLIKLSQYNRDVRSLVQFGQELLDKPREETDNGFFGRLPDELILKIFSDLDLISLCRCCRVNRLFRDVGYSSTLYAKLCLKSHFSHISDRSLTSLSRRCGRKTLTHLDLSWCGNYSTLSAETLLTFLRNSGSGLLRLRLNNCHAATSGTFLSQLDFLAPNLEELSLSNCHLINSSHFSVLKAFTRMKHLNVRCTQITQFHLLSFLSSSGLSLQTLNLSECSLINGGEIMTHIGRHNGQLRSLDFWRVQHVSNAGLVALSRGCPHLEELDLGWCSSIAGHDYLSELVRNCPHLSRLSLTAQRFLVDAELELLSHLVELRQLDIMGASRISFDAVVDLLSSLPRLELVDLTYCELVDSDAERMKSLVEMFPNCHIVSSLK